VNKPARQMFVLSQPRLRLSILTKYERAPKTNGGTHMIRTAISVLFAGVLMMAPAFAKDPTPEELAKIEKTLKDAGFQSWDDIDRDGDVWEVDDAIDKDGKQFDVKIDAKTFEIVGKRGE
jgi:hypothetical protein